MEGMESLGVINQTGAIARRLEELEPGIADGELRNQVRALSASLTLVFAQAPGHGQLSGNPASKQQIDAARKGETEATNALQRLSVLQTRGAK